MQFSIMAIKLPCLQALHDSAGVCSQAAPLGCSWVGILDLYACINKSVATHSCSATCIEACQEAIAIVSTKTWTRCAEPEVISHAFWSYLTPASRLLWSCVFKAEAVRHAKLDGRGVRERRGKVVGGQYRQQACVQRHG